MVTSDDGSDVGPLSGEVPAVDIARYRARRLRMRLLELLDALIVAMERRELQAVWDLLDEDEAVRWFPNGLRQEALTIARLPKSSLRAPIRTYQFYHQLQQLDNEPLELTGDPRQLTLDLGVSPSSGAVLAFPDRPAAPPDDPRRGGGTDRRRSGSR
jgi:hypothetical protein